MLPGTKDRMSNVVAMLGRIAFGSGIAMLTSAYIADVDNFQMIAPYMFILAGAWLGWGRMGDE